MNLSIEQVRILRQDGSPLELRIVPSGDGFHGRSFFRVEVEGREPFEIETHQKIDSLSKEMGDIFRFYPHEVRINGQTVHREPPPELAEVFVTQFTGQEERNHSFRKYDLEEVDTKNRQEYYHGNTLAGGVRCHLRQLRENETKSYYSELPGSFQHRRALMTVDLKPLYIMDNDEMDAISGEGESARSQRAENSVAHSTAKLSVLKRAKAQVQRTMDHPNIPPVYEGEVFHYFLTQGGGSYFETGVPIAVHGTPVTICNTTQTNAATVSAVEALYRSDHNFVPVQGIRDLEGTKHVTEFRFEHTPWAEQEIIWCMEKVQDITLVVRVEDQDEQRVQADFAMDGYSQCDKRIMFVPGQINQEDLSECMLRGYWEEFGGTSSDDMKYDFEMMHNDFLELTLAAMENPETAFRRQLQRAADSFTSDIPTPDQPITVTSSNGQIVMTASPG